MSKDVRLVSRGRSVTLQTDEGQFSYFHPNKLFTGLGWDAQTASLLFHVGPVQNILLLGLGGGTVARQCRAVFPNARIVGVDSSAFVLGAAERNFNIKEIDVDIAHQCGAEFVQSTSESFDAILDDMWPLSAGAKIALTRNDWPELIKKRLQMNGLYALNLYSREERAEESAIASKVLSREFRQITEVHPGPGQTMMMVAGDRLLAPQQARTKLNALPRRLRLGMRHVKFRAHLIRR